MTFSLYKLNDACDFIYLDLCVHVCKSEGERDRDKVYMCTINSSNLAVVKHGAQYHLQYLMADSTMMHFFHSVIIYVSD